MCLQWDFQGLDLVRAVPLDPCICFEDGAWGKMREEGMPERWSRCPSSPLFKVRWQEQVHLVASTLPHTPLSHCSRTTAPKATASLHPSRTGSRCDCCCVFAGSWQACGLITHSGALGGNCLEASLLTCTAGLRPDKLKGLQHGAKALLTFTLHSLFGQLHSCAGEGAGKLLATTDLKGSLASS